jgi:peptide/nickel transport system substrate-binding protein
MIAERYDNYWQGTPAMEGGELRFVSDANARILAVQNG